MNLPGSARRGAMVRIAAIAVIAVGNLLPGPVPAWARTATVCLGPGQSEGCFPVQTTVIGGRAFQDYVVTRPGSLLFDRGARMRELATMSPDTSALYCAVNPLAAIKASLPTVTFGSAKVIVNASVFPFNGRTRIDDVAKILFTGIETSDGLALPKFALDFARERGQSRVGLHFRPDLGPDVTGIPGLTDEWYFVDAVTGEVSFPRLGGMPEPLRRLVYAIAHHLPSIFSAATEVVVIPGPADPQWSMGEIVAVATKFSAAAFVTPQPLLDPIVALACDLSPNGNTCDRLPELWAARDYFARYGADYLGGGDPATGGVLLANLRNWANTNALSAFPGIQMGQPGQPDFRPKYEVQQFLVPVITAWSLLRQDAMVTAADRALIDQWIGRVVAYATEPFGGAGAPYFPFNVGYLTLGVRMAWGIITGSDAAVAEGVERIYMGLHQMRPDGSFPREVARGACAIRYQNLQTLNLLYLAELAARQGYDAYALSVDGRTLHTAVKFLLDAVDDISVIAGYAAMDPTNCNNPSVGMEYSTTVLAVPDGVTFSAWLEPYIARFPNHANSVRLVKLLEGGLTANRSIFHPLSGGNTTCFSAGGNAGRPAPPNFQGLWWSSSESGWGINFAHQGDLPHDIVFATWFTFGADGTPQWYAIRAERTATNVYSGPVSSYTGPPFSAVPFPANANVRTQVGTATITFAADGRSATFTYTVNGITLTKQIVPQEFASPVPTCAWGAQPDLALATNYQDLWWVTDGNESGWGINFTHQGKVIFATWFTYDASGKAWWLQLVAQEAAAKVYSGPVKTATGPPFSAAPFDPGAVARTTVGNATITIIDGNHARFDYTVNGVAQSKNLKRQVFAAPGTVCR